MPSRQIFSAIVYVPRTGCQWKALPRESVRANAERLHFRRRRMAGFFLRLGQAGLAEMDIANGWFFDAVQRKKPPRTST
jgi:transposase